MKRNILIAILFTMLMVLGSVSVLGADPIKLVVSGQDIYLQDGDQITKTIENEDGMIVSVRNNVGSLEVAWSNNEWTTQTNEDAAKALEGGGTGDYTVVKNVNGGTSSITYPTIEEVSHQTTPLRTAENTEILTSAGIKNVDSLSQEQYDTALSAVNLGDVGTLVGQGIDIDYNKYNEYSNPVNPPASSTISPTPTLSTQTGSNDFDKTYVPKSGDTANAPSTSAPSGTLSTPTLGESTSFTSETPTGTGPQTSTWPTGAFVGDSQVLIMAGTNVGTIYYDDGNKKTITFDKEQAAQFRDEYGDQEIARPKKISVTGGKLINIDGNTVSVLTGGNAETTLDVNGELHMKNLKGNYNKAAGATINNDGSVTYADKEYKPIEVEGKVGWQIKGDESGKIYEPNNGGSLTSKQSLFTNSDTKKNIFLSSKPTDAELEQFDSGTILTTGSGTSQTNSIVLKGKDTRGRDFVDAVAGSSERGMFVVTDGKAAYDKDGKPVPGISVPINNKEKYGDGATGNYYISNNEQVTYINSEGDLVTRSAGDPEALDQIKKGTLVLTHSVGADSKTLYTIDPDKIPKTGKIYQDAEKAWVKTTIISEPRKDEDGNEVLDKKGNKIIETNLAKSTVLIGESAITGGADTGVFDPGDLSAVINLGEYNQLKSTFKKKDGYIYYPTSALQDGKTLTPDANSLTGLKDKDAQAFGGAKTTTVFSDKMNFGTDGDETVKYPMVVSTLRVDENGKLVESGGTAKTSHKYYPLDKDGKPQETTIDSTTVVISGFEGKLGGIINTATGVKDGKPVYFQHARSSYGDGGLFDSGSETKQDVFVRYQVSTDEKGKTTQAREATYVFYKKTGDFTLVGGKNVPIYSETEIKINSDGKYIINGEIKENLEGSELTDDQKERMQVIQQRKTSTFRLLMDSFNRVQGWSAFSSLFCKGECFSEWSREVDIMFHDNMLGTEYWTEAICKVDIESSNENAVYSLSGDGLLYSSAMIHGTRQRVSTPDGPQYLYRVAFYVQNPSDQKSTGLLGGLLGGKEKGKKPKFDTSDLSRDDKKIWNVIKKGSQEIANANAQSSQTATNEDMEFNVVFYGDQTYNLFKETEVVEPGDEITYLAGDSFASYSSNNYDRVCIEFSGFKPINAFFEEIDVICSPMKDISNEAPSYIEVEERKSSKENSDDIF